MCIGRNGPSQENELKACELSLPTTALSVAWKVMARPCLAGGAMAVGPDTERERVALDVYRSERSDLRERAQCSCIIVSHHCIVSGTEGDGQALLGRWCIGGTDGYGEREGCNIALAN